jgi:hypothetical protein
MRMIEGEKREGREGEGVRVRVIERVRGKNM